MKFKSALLISLCSIFLFSCKSTKVDLSSDLEVPKNNEFKMLFAGDIMAHSPNYNMKDYEIIWDDVRDLVSSADLAFGNIEAPLDTTKQPSNYPYFNMPEKYVQAVINAGFDVFSLCNNHTNDQEISGIKQTQITADNFTKQAESEGKKLYFAGLKENAEAEYSYHIINQNGWKILFLPMTEILNRPLGSDYINFVNSSSVKRAQFIEYCKQLRQNNPCDLFILSWHANETEYIRSVTESQEEFYQDLLNAGIDIIWANHAHIIKNRKIIVNSETQTSKVIMYANGNTISAQRTNPNLTAKNPVEERDNTGDGLFYILTFTKDENNIPRLKKAEPVFITTYITTSKEYVIKIMNNDFIDYLYENNRTAWAAYIKRRIKINKDYTKDLIEWK